MGWPWVRRGGGRVQACHATSIQARGHALEVPSLAQCLGLTVDMLATGLLIGTMSGAKGTDRAAVVSGRRFLIDVQVHLGWNTRTSCKAQWWEQLRAS